MSWLLDTLVWTGALIALVLFLRRPVSRYLGAQAAYALWLLPVLRLVLPPLTLPAWMNPAPPVEEAAPSMALANNATDFAALGMTPAPTELATAAPFSIGTDELVAALVALWLTGAIAFVAVRVRDYLRMRQTLLANAIEVGEVDGIRLVETPLTEAPIAFGVRERIVALPEGFLDRSERVVRDLALDHELAHHRGHDLLANFLVQPLFALHWFNPLGWYGWRALRSDQEAACDARVVSSRSRSERVRYAEVIASFATSPRLALAAPMACPVLGDKSIIHRLRSLTMSDISNRRRMGARLGIAAAALTLPLTATITYAETMPKAPEAPVPPAPPAAPAAPLPPEAPLAPAALQAVAEVDEEVEHVEDPHVVHEHVEETVTADGKRKVRKYKWVSHDSEKMSAEERAELKAEIDEAMKEMHEGLAEAHEAQKFAMIELKDELGEMARIEVKCSGDKPVTEKIGKDGKKVMVICQTAIEAQARKGLMEARREIASNGDMDAEIRAEVLKSLDEEIAKFDSKN